MTYNDILGSLPNQIINDYERFDLIQWIEQAVKLLPEINTVEKVKCLEVENCKVQLPHDFKKLYALFQTVYTEDISSLDLYEQITKLSNFDNNFIPAKYVGDISFLCTNCPNINKCSEEFTIKDGYIYTTFNGTILLHYAGIQCNEQGEVVLPDSATIQEYITKYIFKKIYEVKMLQKEENSINMYQLYRQEADIWFRKARSEFFMLNFNADTVKSISFGKYLDLLNHYNNGTFR